MKMKRKKRGVPPIKMNNEKVSQRVKESKKRIKGVKGFQESIR